MLQDLKKHKIAYSLLSLAAIIYLVLVYLSRHNNTMLFYLTIFFGAVYFFWGIAHHIYERNLTFRTVVEYILVTALGISIMSTLLL